MMGRVGSLMEPVRRALGLLPHPLTIVEKRSDFDHSLSEVLGAIAQVTQASVVSITSFESGRDRAEKFVRTLAEWVIPAEQEQNSDLDTGNGLLGTEYHFRNFLPRWQRILEDGDYIGGPVGDLPEEERLILSREGIKDILILPAFSDGQQEGRSLVGALNLAFREEQSWSEDEIQIFWLAADTLCRWYRTYEAGKELPALRRKAEECDRLKSNFFNRITHDLRTPLNGILGYTQIFKSGFLAPLTDEQLNGIEVIERSGKRLLTMINDILTLSRLEEGSLPVRSGIVGFPAFLRRIGDAHFAEAGSKGVRFNIEIDESLPDFFDTDSGLLEQVLNILVRNAFVATDEGTVRFLVTRRRSAVRFIIGDSGEEISREAAAALFDPLRPTSGAIQKGYGSGLEMAVCRRIVGLLGGRLYVWSPERGGKLFWFSLPSADSIGDTTSASAAESVRVGAARSGARSTQSADGEEPEHIEIDTMDDESELIPEELPEAEIIHSLIALARSGDIMGIRREAEFLLRGREDLQNFRNLLRQKCYTYSIREIEKFLETYYDQDIADEC